MKNKTSNQPDAFAWENMSKAQKILSTGAIVFILTVIGKGCIESSQISTARAPECDSAELARISDKYVTASEHYTGETIDNMAELETVYGLAAAAVEECKNN